ncbi:hypothetical protein ECO07P1_00209 [Escherichia phage ECO07P1]|nr:hypothetical protein ECO07P1_00209 [Escherichia phage ECO07P1]
MMTDTQLFEYLYFSPKTVKNKLVNHFEILANNNVLSEFYPKQYKLQKRRIQRMQSFVHCS